MDIMINGVPLREWKYTRPEWWMIRDDWQGLPEDGSARLMSGVREQVEHLRETGNLIVNMVGAHSSDYVTCDLPIYGLCYISLGGK